MCNVVDNQDKDSSRLLLILIVVVVCIIIISWIGIDCFISCNEERGQFGDKFGSVNALFSGLAFAGLIYTITLQRKELGLQRVELSLTRKEMADQTHEFEEQNNTLHRQRFENTFFQMMSLQQEIVNGLSYKYYVDEKFGEYESGYAMTKRIERAITGRDVFCFLYENETISLKNREGVQQDFTLKNMIKEYGVDAYNESLYPMNFDHYFRHLYRIIKFIKKSTLIDEKEKYQYTSMLRGTLSRYELVWLFYNCLSRYGDEFFKPLVEEYALLKNIREDLLADEKENLTLYAEGAYKHLQQS